MVLSVLHYEFCGKDLIRGSCYLSNCQANTPFISSWQTEYFADETTLLHAGPKWGLNFNLATPLDYKFVPQLCTYLNYIHRVSKHIRYFMPVTSHDSGTKAQESGSIMSTIPRYVVAALLGTGATGIIQGSEQEQKLNCLSRKGL